MKVVEIGNLQERDGEDLPEVGIIIEATMDELKAIAGNIFGKMVELSVVEESEETDGSCLNGVLSKKTIDNITGRMSPFDSYAMKPKGEN